MVVGYRLYVKEYMYVDYSRSDLAMLGGRQGIFQDNIARFSFVASR